MIVRWMCISGGNDGDDGDDGDDGGGIRFSLALALFGLWHNSGKIYSEFSGNSIKSTIGRGPDGGFAQPITSKRVNMTPM